MAQAIVVLSFVLVLLFCAAILFWKKMVAAQNALEAERQVRYDLEDLTRLAGKARRAAEKFRHLHGRFPHTRELQQELGNDRGVILDEFDIKGIGHDLTGNYILYTMNDELLDIRVIMPERVGEVAL